MTERLHLGRHHRALQLELRDLGLHRLPLTHPSEGVLLKLEEVFHLGIELADLGLKLRHLPFKF